MNDDPPRRPRQADHPRVTVRRPEDLGSDVADEVDVSASTVRNRIRKLEDADILMGYRPEVNYEKAGYQPGRSSSVPRRYRSGSNSHGTRWRCRASSPSAK